MEQSEVRAVHVFLFGVAVALTAAVQTGLVVVALCSARF